MQIREALLGADHPDTLVAARNVGSSLQLQKRSGEAEPFLRMVRSQAAGGGLIYV